jgi:hypothetical protein
MIKNDLPFAARTAQRLMKIAADPKISNAAHGSLLPDSWRTVYELSKLPEAEFTQAAQAGSIHSKMTRHDASQLVNVHVVTKRVNVGGVAYVKEESKPLFSLPPSLRPEVIEAAPLGVLEKLDKLEEVATDLAMILQRCDISGNVERRIKAVANRLLALIGQETTQIH